MIEESMRQILDIQPTVMRTGRVERIIGPVIDVHFPDGDLPPMLNALVIEANAKRLIVEVQEHIDRETVRGVGMGPTAGFRRDRQAMDTGEPIAVPVGPRTLGRMFNTLGEPIDGAGPLSGVRRVPIHKRRQRSRARNRPQRSSSPG